MIEIIQEENWEDSKDKKGLPKNIKQVGLSDAGDRIYIENSAYQKMHPCGQSAEKMVYVMLGRFDDFAGHICVFVEDVVKMNEVEFQGKLPAWNDDSWGYLYRKICPEHEDMIIVGWAVDICGQVPGMTAQLERVHQTYFGGVHQILFLMDTLEKEEVFFSNKNGYLKRREGFYIYYDKRISSKGEAAIEKHKEQKVKKVEKEKKEERILGRQENYRSYKNARKGGVRVQQSVVRSSYSTTVLLLVVIAALGYTSFQNYQKMEQMEYSLNQMELQTVMQTEAAQGNVVRVEEVVGIVTPQVDIQVSDVQVQDTQSTSTESTQIGGAQTGDTQTEGTQMQDIQNEKQVTETVETPSEPILSEAEIYLAQGYYIIEAGDNLAGICRKIYHTTAMMDKLCEINKIDNPDSIFIGQRLVLPN